MLSSPCMPYGVHRGNFTLIQNFSIMTMTGAQYLVPILSQINPVCIITPYFVQSHYQDSCHFELH